MDRAPTIVFVAPDVRHAEGLVAEARLARILDATLLDVSVVTFPAYPQTEVTVPGVKFPLGWYQETKAAPKVVPDTTADRERLELMLRLAQSIN